MNTLGERIAYARKKRGITQVKLAEKCGLTQQSIGSLEVRGSEHSKHAPAIAKALGVSMEWLIAGKGREPNWDEEPYLFQVNEQSAEYKAGGQFDWSALETIMIAVDEVLDDRGLQMDTRKKARLLRLLYELYLENEDKPIDKSKVIQLVRLAG